MRLSVLILLLFASVCAPAQYTGTVELDRIVALVNDDVILNSELSERMRTVITQLREQGMSAPPGDVLQKQVLERLILNRLQLQLAEENGIRVDDNTLNRALRSSFPQSPKRKTLRQRPGLGTRSKYAKRRMAVRCTPTQ